MGRFSGVANFFDKLLLKRSRFSIVSDNCWGNELYSILGREYNTPFVGLYVHAPDFIEIIKNFEKFIEVEICYSHFKKDTDFPIALVDGCEIFFLHYASIEEAVSKWNRRRLRLIDFIKSDGMDSLIFKCCSEEHQYKTDFNALQLRRKVFFVPSNFIKNKRFFRDGKFIDGLQLFRYRIFYYKAYLNLFR